MNPPAAPSPVLFFDTINAYQKSAALRAAIELDLFSAIGQDPATATELAARMGHPHRGVRILADYLTILGFLVKEEGRYTLTPDSAVFLDRKSPAYLGESIEFFLAPDLMEGFNQLAATVRRGTKADAGTTEKDHSVWVRFARVMAPLMVLPARGAAELVPLDPTRDTRILDISASHGTYGITLAEKSPRAHLVALDWQAVLAVAEENARKAGLGARFSTIAGSAFTVDLGSDYDVILIPNFLHHFSHAECVNFLRRAHHALRRGGSVVIVEFIPNEDRVTPPPAAGFSLVMLGSTPEGDAYTFAEYQAMLVEAGFPIAEFHPLPPTAQSAVVARKA
jgi:2-polyprenyl-3-methyl-5-hydroxy-6-metoxy-1,4-benzoquinol methylase